MLQRVGQISCFADIFIRTRFLVALASVSLLLAQNRTDRCLVCCAQVITAPQLC